MKYKPIYVQPMHFAVYNQLRKIKLRGFDNDIFI